ncbi:MAG: SDR family oxidoreductase [Candidatus Eremiobacterota bacterium]
MRRHVVITGTSRGLGASLALEFERLGERVSGCSSRDVDVRVPERVADWAGRLDPPDLLINNAAVALPSRRLWEVDPEEFSRAVDTNLKGVYHVLRAFLPRMVERGSGVVVNMSSDWGRSTSPLVATYCATKWAIEGLTRALAKELPFGLAAVAVDPGNIDTDMLRLALGEELARRYPGAEEWAAQAAPRLLELGPQDNGRSLRIPP